MGGETTIVRARRQNHRPTPKTRIGVATQGPYDSRVPRTRDGLGMAWLLGWTCSVPQPVLFLCSWRPRASKIADELQVWVDTPRDEHRVRFTVHGSGCVSKSSAEILGVIFSSLEVSTRGRRGV